MSSPRFDKTPPAGTPLAVNAGINKADWPCNMASLQKISEILYRLKQPAWVTKIDWSDAYKHLEVCEADRHLQVLRVGNRYFVEEKITFGCTSSPGHFEKPSWFLLLAACSRAGADRRNACKQVDDALIFSKYGDPACQRVYDSYRELAPRMGVKLAPEEDKDKAFPPSTSGVCLGVAFDLMKWTWAVPAKKIVVLRHDLQKLVVDEVVQNGMLEELAGRLNHYAVLVPTGMWERSFIHHLHRADRPKSVMVKVTVQAREQAAWWLASLPAAAIESRILDLSVGCRDGFDLNLYPDAAGGSMDHSLNGAGGVVWETGHWYSRPWPRWIHRGQTNSLGMHLQRKLTTLEGLAALMLLTVEPRLVRMRSVCIWSDNQGLVYAYRGKGSRCPYAYTIARALAQVARGLDVLLEVRKTPRCSNKAEESADALSKGDLARFERNCAHRQRRQSPVARVLVDWLKDPFPTNQLGRQLLLEIEDSGTEVLWWNQKPKRGR